MEEINKTDLPESEVTVPVKYNKETRELSLEDASTLAQKGLKFEAIEKDYIALKSLAEKENKSVPQYISDLAAKRQEVLRENLTKECGGNEKMADRILSLEAQGEKELNLKEVYDTFPDIKTMDDLPEEVLDKCRLKGTLPLDEYLRYLLSQKRKVDEARKKQKESEASATGSLANLKGAENPETQEFLRGLWK